MRVGDLVRDDREGLRRGRSEGELSAERRALLMRASDEREDDSLESAARVYELARPWPPGPGDLPRQS